MGDDAGRSRTPANPLMAPVGSDRVALIHNLNAQRPDTGRSTADDLQPETPMPAETPAPGDQKEQKKSFMKTLNERMRALSDNLQGAVRNYHRLTRERNACLELLGLDPPPGGSGAEPEDDVISLEDEIRRVLEETGYQAKPRPEGDGDQ